MENGNSVSKDCGNKAKYADNAATNFKGRRKVCDKLLDTILDTVSQSNAVNGNSVPRSRDDMAAKSGASSKTTPSELPQNITNYRSEVWTDDESSDSTFSLSSSSDSLSGVLTVEAKNVSKPRKEVVVTKGEFALDDLPPIEDLHISLKEQEMQKIGKVYAKVEQLVIVQSLENLQAVDLDSVLFLAPDKPLGRIFDVFGPVVRPFYSIRFNSAEHIAKKGITIDADVFFAPEKTEITSYVFMDQLLMQKGSDASWKDNNEPPEEYLDYSDDEQEKMARQKRRAKNHVPARIEDDHRNPEPPSTRKSYPEKRTAPPPRSTTGVTNSRIRILGQPTVPTIAEVMRAPFQTKPYNLQPYISGRPIISPATFRLQPPRTTVSTNLVQPQSQPMVFLQQQSIVTPSFVAQQQQATNFVPGGPRQGNVRLTTFSSSVQPTGPPAFPPPPALATFIPTSASSFPIRSSQPSTAATTQRPSNGYETPTFGQQYYLLGHMTQVPPPPISPMLPTFMPSVPPPSFMSPPPGPPPPSLITMPTHQGYAPHPTFKPIVSYSVPVSTTIASTPPLYQPQQLHPTMMFQAQQQPVRHLDSVRAYEPVRPLEQVGPLDPNRSSDQGNPAPYAYDPSLSIPLQVQIPPSYEYNPYGQ